ncbi:VOC family protein [uncultured Phenylobacterium sp.]|uniref:VOC family protein n=1 Tax=uncultured Phenylobacterium sp. TaxID=349273 RepID=UPI0025CF0F56|nr:VOC family protein [uncultured Phenylobacterium sp.]
MAFSLGPVGQIALGVADADRSEAFYGEVLGLRKLFRFGGLAFFDCAGLRLLLEQDNGDAPKQGSPIYFRVADIVLARRELELRGVAFVDQTHLTAPMEDHDLWMTFFNDPDGHVLALMMEAPKGWKPSA